MTAKEIIGVDFSGAQEDQNTWIAQGCLEEERLRLVECSPISRSALTHLLAKQTGPVAAALDFPFGVPEAFASWWAPEAKTLADLWRKTAHLRLEQFVALRDEYVPMYVAQHGKEPKRLGDMNFPECFSPLHGVRPNMVPMTFYGMQMLHQVRMSHWEAPPLETGAGEKVLLEAMPGAALRALGLPYKGYKNGQRARKLREDILDGLAQRSGISLPNLGAFRGACVCSHDALDAVVAAVTAALWCRGQAAFLCPVQRELPLARLEGWLYAPVHLRQAQEVA
ncbi:MAG: DUF429 domain-containing protein [SAR202 cluster bacterium]|nr:DUF429 domain-containing protein [SAR202 cluster bacterium]